jgi:hypothetical protein
MKISDIKQEVYKLTHTRSSQQFKREYPNYCKGRDLRYKVSWAEILHEVIEQSLQTDIASLSMDDIQKWLDKITLSDTEQELRHCQMYYAMGSLLGWSVSECDTRWTNIKRRAKLEANFEMIFEGL